MNVVENANFFAEGFVLFLHSFVLSWVMHTNLELEIFAHVKAYSQGLSKIQLELKQCQ